MQLYSGDILPKQAWEMLAKDEYTYLIDVRTKAEWHYVGKPDLRSLKKDSIFIEWRLLPKMELNNNFVEELVTHIPNKSSTLIFLRRTGGRSMESAACSTQAGYSNCYNILYGFEGDINNQGHRGKVNGWKADLLPWRQD